jgi:hypothetical protein
VTLARQQRWVAVLACLALACIVLGNGFLVHTDDGCATEIHCVTCRTALGLAADVVALPVIVPVLVVASNGSPVPIRRPDAVSPRDVDSRGPPAA